MKKLSELKETMMTLFLATKYSLAFCWRNSRGATMFRIVIAVCTTLLMYLGIQSNGFMINSVQNSIGKFSPTDSFYKVFVEGGILYPVLFISGVILFGMFLSRFNWYYRSKWNQTLRFANQRELNNHRATLDIARFKSKEYDDLSKRIQELPTSWQTRIWFSDEMLSLFTTSVSFVLFGASLLWYKPVYALILVVTSLPMMFTEFRLGALWWGLFEKMVPHNKKRSVLERPYHGPTAFAQALMWNQMSPLRRKIDINIGEVVNEYDSIRSTVLKKEIVTNFFAIAGLCGILVNEILFTVTHAGQIGTFTVIFAAAKTFQGNLESIVTVIANQWNNAKGVILIEKDFLGLKPLVQTEYPVVPSFENTPRIRFEDVKFIYPESENEVLRGVNFVIEPGSKTVILGKSGNGKSTLLHLLMRQYDPTSGNIFVGETNLRSIEPNVWSNVVSALMQEYTVLERKIGEEIASSRLDEPVDMDRVAESARFAHFDGVVSSDPDGYESQIGVDFGGRDFSGGERQRLALARVHYRGTPILILDEPDSKLDAESAQKVIDQVFALSGVTVIMITHHVSRAERCDKVIVMGEGRVVEEGTPSELLAKGEIYASMLQKDRERAGLKS
ncbi:MAG: ABC transporter ATP-binding protein [Patescibacteria group bacterium]